MRRKVFFLIALVGLVVAVAAFVRYVSTRGPKTGELRVDSVSTVSVFLNDKNVGTSPYREKIDAGNYTLKLVPQAASDQLISWEGKITVGQNLLSYVNANLSQSELTTAVDIVWLEKITSKQSELSITTNPDGATVLIDDAVRGVTPITLQDISSGDHSVSVTSTGFQTRTLTIRTTPGYKLIANLKLALTSGSTLPETTPAATASATVAPAKTKTATQSAVQPTEPTKPYVIIKDTPTGFLRVRMEPATTATEAGRVNPGEKYSIVDSQNGWYEINYDSTNTGWVSGQYTEKVE
jgi:uncharacterized protein YgiM (DUF1202 family)